MSMNCVHQARMTGGVVAELVLTTIDRDYWF